MPRFAAAVPGAPSFLPRGETLSVPLGGPGSQLAERNVGLKEQTSCDSYSPFRFGRPMRVNSDTSN
jgi:hypothetical protein